jgi:mannose-6-phosphate isomerase-like protein (cupin superfamily)
MSDTDGTISESENALKRRRITFFKEADAPLLHETNLMDGNYSPAVDSGLSKMREQGYDDGHVLKCLFSSPEFSLVHIWFKANFPLPAHHHNCDCVYYVVAGELHMGNRVIGEGEGFFIPAGAGYSYTAGPKGLQLLEFRATSRFDITIADGTPQYWQRLVDICRSNRDTWKIQRPP